jgi:hypothetical protein
MDTTSPPELLPLARAARRIGVTAVWLKGEADAGRVPYLRAGPRYLFHLAALTSALAERARNGEEVAK